MNAAQRLDALLAEQRRKDLRENLFGLFVVPAIWVGIVVFAFFAMLYGSWWVQTITAIGVCALVFASKCCWLIVKAQQRRGQR